MVKRGSSGLSLMLALDKPKGLTSHDVVNRVRRVFGEKRVGHTGTLDPLASGVLCVAVGPATRLDAYLAGHDKTYTMDIAFGIATETDDVEGAPVHSGEVPQELFDAKFASGVIAGLVGKGEQVPPRYSAIKVDGQKSYAAARKGSDIELKPRAFEIYRAYLEDIRGMRLEDLLQERDDNSAAAENVGLERLIPVWRVTMTVSGGTYMRSIARDLGERFGCGAFVADLRRTAVGTVLIEDCVSLDLFEQDPRAALIDPLELLDVRCAFIDDARIVARIDNGNALDAERIELHPRSIASEEAAASPATQAAASPVPCFEGEVVALIVDNRIKALYSYDAGKARFVPKCVFPVGVERGSDLSYR